MKIKSNGEFEGKIGDFVIVTNADFDSTDSILHPVRKLRMMSSGKNKGKEISVIRVDTQDEFLDVGNGTRYKFDSSIISYLQESKDFIKHEIGREVSDEKIEDFLNKLVFAVNLPSGAELREIIKSEFCKEFSNTDMKHFCSRYREEALNLMEKEEEEFLSYEQAKALLEEIREEILGEIWFGMMEPVASFTGRGSELKALHNALRKSTGRQAVTSQVATTSGLGGVGKSELARKYAYKYGKYYGGNVIWINAESFEYMKNSFLRLAEDKRVGISPKGRHGGDKMIEAIVEEIHAFFARRERESLFIFDNAEEYKDIRRFLPSSLPLGCKKPYILITSRNKNWRIAESEGEIKTIQLGVFKETEAVKFVKRALNIRDNLQDEEIKKLTQELQYFPLALGQAVAYINEKNIVLSCRGKEKIGVSDYLKKYEEEAEKLLDFESKYKSDRYTKTTFITWKIIIDAIAQKECGPEALNVLEIMAYLAPDKICIEEIFSKLVTDNEEKLWSAVELLDRYSIIDLKEGVANIHRLVQKVTELSLQKEGREEEVLRKALGLINSGDLAQDSISHVASIWWYSSKHSRLIDDFCFNSIYGKQKYTPLHSLAASGDYQAIKAILTRIGEKCLDKLYGIINANNKYDGTPLHLAVESGELNVVEYLISKGANIDVKKSGWAPLHIAAIGKLDIVKYLIDKGADVNTKNKYGVTALHRAVYHEKLNVVEYLVDKGANINANAVGPFFSGTPLHCAVHSRSQNTVEYLVDKGADTGAKDEKGSTPLHHAAKGDNLNIVKCLVEQGADIYTKGRIGGMVPLHVAAKCGSVSIIKYFIGKGIDINIKDKYSNTSLHFAIEKGNLSAVRYLIETGADINAKNEYSETPLHFASCMGSLIIVESLVNKGVDINAESSNGRTPLHCSALCGSYDTAKCLIKKGANVNPKDKYGNTPLHFAAMKGKVDIAKMLLKHNADVNAKNNEGRTALYYATKYNHQKLVELLLAHTVSAESV
ncbi:MAG: ankyrin repeat domain-containing protein [Rickettsiales bacterium]|nr:ankyrin repeat domain-containing protein [Rickettsiales bacterium]